MKSATHYIFITLMLGVCCFGQKASAAEVTFMVSPSSVPGDTSTVVEAHIDPQGTALNALEGVIGLRGTGVSEISSVSIETGGSLLTLWPVNPTYSREEGVIRFTGGSQTGFQEEGLLFRIRIFSQKPGEIVLSWLGGSAYEHNGQGTPHGISSRSLVLALTHGEQNPHSGASVDLVPPYFDSLLVSRDDDVYGGKYFASFHAQDDVSGVVRYEVIENHLTTEVHNGMYVLMDQNRKSRVVIIAYDQAGNSTSIKLPTRYEPFYIAVGIVIALLMFGILIILRFYLHRKQLR